MTQKSYRVKTRKVVFSKGPIHLVDCDVRMPDGVVLSRQIIEHPGSVVIVPKVSATHFLLVRQFRFAARDWLWEFPAGGRNPGETLRHAARRELMEETGFAPKQLSKMVHFYPTPGISSEMMYLFLAEDLYPAHAEPDEDEDLEVKRFSLKQLRSMIRTGKIVDAKTILSIYYLCAP